MECRRMGIATAILSITPPILAALAKRVRPRVRAPFFQLQFQLQANRRTMSVAAAESAAAEAEELGGGKEEVVVQYVVLRRDLIDEWPIGSVVSQGCHASVAAVWQFKDDPHTLLYCSPYNLPSMHKITLEVKGESQLLSLSEKLNSSGISHFVWIEQPENFPTCLATKPYPKSTVSPFFKKLKLCK